ncbi:hypothetical protein Poli38472_004428 [Pythium oligandrum]|uniref:Phosphorylated adapter RNA export protein n=1 Tax=Pythium oligandrum TaxID=41045 RepID=A0A8K1CAA0_PYTOL|nr:hypothetical protein Poli38472_004428 [Pythium oligandrum]|eukprot:TMW59359.1 hypothetical protein Poli38472_004428 [Pythium oligandrum]
MEETSMERASVDATTLMASSAPSTQQPKKPKHKKNPKGASDGRSVSGKRQQQQWRRRPPPRDMARILSEVLREPKQGLLQRVVRIAGPKIAWDVLQETLQVEQSGGQQVNAFGSGRPEAFLVATPENTQPVPRKRTTGGVYFTLLKNYVTKESYQEIYAIENQRKKEVKKKVRYRRKQEMEKVINGLGFEDIQIDNSAPHEPVAVE